MIGLFEPEDGFASKIDSLVVNCRRRCCKEKDAAAGCRVPAPGPEEVVTVDLGASWNVLDCWIGVVCVSP